MTGANRPMTGFMRPGSAAARPDTGANARVQTAYQGARPGTSAASGGGAAAARPMTALGRQMRLGTASLTAVKAGGFIDVDQLDMAKYGQRPALARTLAEYCLIVECNPRRALDLAAAATVAEEYKNWWWKHTLARAYYALGMLRDAEQQLRSALRTQPSIEAYMLLAKVQLRQDQPLAAVDTFHAGMEAFPGDCNPMLGAARVYEALNRSSEAASYWKRVLTFDGACIEAVASLAAHAFYSDQPEVSLKYYRRLLAMGIHSPELWNNVGLACFHAGQFDMALPCFERALQSADDATTADVWFNLSTIALGAGNLAMAEQALKICLAADPAHAGALNNLGVLASRKTGLRSALTHLAAATQAAEHAYEPAYNSALLAWRAGSIADAHQMVQRALAAFPEHTESQLLAERITAELSAV